MIKRLGTEMGRHRARDAPRLEIHIEELVLHGFGHLDRAELGTVVEEALGQLLAEHGMPSGFHQGGHMNSLDGGTFTAQPDSGTHDIGGRIAQAIYRSFGS